MTESVGFRNDPYVQLPVPKSQSHGNGPNATGVLNTTLRIRFAGSSTETEYFTHVLLFGISAVTVNGTVVVASMDAFPEYRTTTYNGPGFTTSTLTPSALNRSCDAPEV